MQASSVMTICTKVIQQVKYGLTKKQLMITTSLNNLKATSKAEKLLSILRSLTGFSYSPMTVQIFQLFLYLAAKAASIVSVQPLPHHTHPILTPLLIKSKVLHFGGNSTATMRRGFPRGCHSFGDILFSSGDEEKRNSRIKTGVY